MSSPCEGCSNFLPFNELIHIPQRMILKISGLKDYKQRESLVNYTIQRDRMICAVCYNEDANNLENNCSKNKKCLVAGTTETNGTIQAYQDVFNRSQIYAFATNRKGMAVIIDEKRFGRKDKIFFDAVNIYEQLQLDQECVFETTDNMPPSQPLFLPNLAHLDPNYSNTTSTTTITSESSPEILINEPVKSKKAMKKKKKKSKAKSNASDLSQAGLTQCELRNIQSAAKTLKHINFKVDYLCGSDVDDECNEDENECEILAEKPAGGKRTMNGLKRIIQRMEGR